ncbi:DUF5597 domain-containing protein [Aquisalinus luteolus]|nr:DUF5597 domain-containing protein [Aquisalinus luteolus]
MRKMWKAGFLTGLMAIVAACDGASEVDTDVNDAAATQGQAGSGAGNSSTERTATKSVQAQVTALPEIISQDGRHMLRVDGEPFLMLAGQVNNSSNYASQLPEVWPAMDVLNANTVMMPVAWEQVEPVEGEFDFSFVDELVSQARENDKRLVLLWFATWKNTAPKYAPSWVKLDNERFPRIIHEDGELSYALSPMHRSTLEADKKAFIELMSHLKEIDPQHTVIMVQVQNESGVYGTDRDYGPEAQEVFEGQVPEALTSMRGLESGTWQEVFGDDAAEMFHAWHMASFIGEIAAAGREVYDLPMYTNAALRDPFYPGPAGGYASGGPTDNVIDIYLEAAPALEFVSPDIYMRQNEKVEAVLDLYATPDNALFISEIGNDDDYARFFFPSMGSGAIGFAPFGMDYTGYANYPLGGRLLSPETPERIEPFARNYRLVAPMAEKWAQLAFEGPVWGVAEPDDSADQAIDLSGPWSMDVHFDQWQFGMREWNMRDEIAQSVDVPEGNDYPNGGVIVAPLGENEFLITGYDARVFFGRDDDAPEVNWLIDTVEEGHYDEDGNWVMERIWNGDQTDYGLNFIDRPLLLRVRLATY